MVQERLEKPGAPLSDALTQTSEHRNTASLMDAALTRMGGVDNITISSTDTEQSVGEGYRKIVVAMVLNRSKEPTQVYHWIPEPEYKADPNRRKNPALRVTVNGQVLVGVRYEHFFPDKGASNLTIRNQEGDTLLLQFLNTLSSKPGHAVTFSKGELKQVDFGHHPTRTVTSLKQAVVFSEVASTQSSPPRSSARAPEKRTRKTEPTIPLTIQQFFKLGEADREHILSRMSPELRDVVEKGFYRDEAGLHSRTSAEMGMHASTRNYRMQNAVQFIHERIRVAEDGSVSRILSNLEHTFQVFGIQGKPATPVARRETQGRRGKKNKRRKGWSRE